MSDAIERWTTVTATSVQVGDRVHIRTPGDALAIRDMRALPGGGKRLYLTDGTTHDMTSRTTLRAYCRRAP